MFELVRMPDRYIQEKNEFGDVKGSVKYVGDRKQEFCYIHNLLRPFIIDLESTNGTHVNDEVVPPSRYYELRASDGRSTSLNLGVYH